MSGEHSLGITRRKLLQQSVLCGSMWISGFDQLRSPGSFFHRTADARSDSSLLGRVPFSGEGRPPMGEPIGSELDGRLFTDLSSLTPENPVTPTDQFFIRTRASELLDRSTPWTIQVGGIVEKPMTIPIEALTKKAVPMETHLIECSGNTRAAHFGMMSIAEWDGVPVQEVLERAKPKMSGVRVLVSGFDSYKEESMTSVAGAGWIFTPEQLFSSHAFLATKMNGQPLRPDHGAPVRLVIPGWYGCVCIKWVNRIDFVADDAPATSQMQEYAGRTMQTGVPTLARDYQPAIVDLAAMPTRIEKWLLGGKIRYRIAGIQWGGLVPTHGIELRFNPNEEFVPVQNVLSPSSNGWCFWSHEWSPPKTGKFTLRLRLKAANRDARRLDSGYYDRSLEISEI